VTEVVTTLDNALLEEILQQVRPLIGQGKVADYIPALAEVPADRLAIAVCTVDGELFQAGDAAERFSIQSISKVLSLTLALTRYQEPEIWRRVGKEPSGLPFNSLLQLEMEQGKPRNPFINPGALVVCDMLQTRLSAPKQRMLEVVRQLAGEDDLAYDLRVARSEFEHSDRNAAIAYLMKSFGNFENDVITVLQTYFHYCALRMSCVGAGAQLRLSGQPRPRSQRRDGDQPAAGPADQRPDDDQRHVRRRRRIRLSGGDAGQVRRGRRHRGHRAGRVVDRRLVAGAGCFRQLAGGNCGAGTVVSTYRSFDFLIPIWMGVRRSYVEENRVSLTAAGGDCRAGPRRVPMQR
jgi:hypothetical protein